MTPYDRMPTHFNLILGSSVAVLLGWLPYLVFGGEYVSALAGTALTVLAVVAAIRWPRRKVAVVRVIQGRLINPVIRALFARGINPLGLVILETRGRRSGLPRHTPVGNGRVGDDVWIIAEHGLRAQYVRNLQADPVVRVRIRVGHRLVWVDGVAEVLPEDDAAARQRQIVGRHPLRAFNAMMVQVMGADLMTVRVRLQGVAPAVEPVSAASGKFDPAMLSQRRGSFVE